MSNEISNNPNSNPSNPNNDSETSKSRLAALGIVGVLAATALAVPAVAASSDQPAETTVREHQADDDLGAMTLGELSDELAKLGLRLEVEPDGDSNTDDGAGDVDQAVDGDEVDPFAGMSDEEIDALSDEEFFAILDKAGIDYENFDDVEGNPNDTTTDDDADGDSHDHSADEAPEAKFDVDGDRLIVPADTDPDVAKRAEAIWNRFVQLIPVEQRTMLAGFELMGPDYGGAHVYPTDNDPSRWIMGVAPMEDAKELDYVLIHEFAHLLSLNAKEVPPSDGSAADSCPTYFTGEGCALQGSTMAEFVAKFWPAERLAELQKATETEDYEAMDAFYQKHQDEFVTDYAATNPGEDLAEVFTHFVINDRPTGNTIADQKVEMLWNDASLVELRSQIRANMDR